MSENIEPEEDGNAVEEAHAECKKTEVMDFLKKLQELEKARSDWRFKHEKE